MNIPRFPKKYPCCHCRGTMDLFENKYICSNKKCYRHKNPVYGAQVTYIEGVDKIKYDEKNIPFYDEFFVDVCDSKKIIGIVRFKNGNFHLLECEKI